MAIKIKDAEDLKNRLAEAGDKLVVVDFTATWCGPCQYFEPLLDELANEFNDSVIILKVDVDDCKDVAAEYNITGMPTFVFIKKGQKLDEILGGTYDKLKSTIIKHK